MNQQPNNGNDSLEDNPAAWVFMLVIGCILVAAVVLIALIPLILAVDYFWHKVRRSTLTIGFISIAVTVITALIWMKYAVTNGILEDEDITLVLGFIPTVCAVIFSVVCLFRERHEFLHVFFSDEKIPYEEEPETAPPESSAEVNFTQTSQSDPFEDDSEFAFAAPGADRAASASSPSQIDIVAKAKNLISGIKEEEIESFISIYEGYARSASNTNEERLIWETAIKILRERLARIEARDRKKLPKKGAILRITDQRLGTK